MSVVELTCIKIGELPALSAKKFLKNLPHLPQVPRSKLSGKRSSFGSRGSLAISNLPRTCRTCRICPRRDCLCFMELGRLNEPMCDYSGSRSWCQGVTGRIAPTLVSGSVEVLLTGAFIGVVLV